MTDIAASNRSKGLQVFRAFMDLVTTAASFSTLLLLLVIGTGILGMRALDDKATDESKRQFKLPAQTAPYHQLSEADIGVDGYRKNGIDGDDLSAIEALVNRYTLSTTPLEEPITQEDLGPALPPDYLSTHTPLGIDATEAMLLGGTLKAGRMVDVTIVPDPVGNSHQASVDYSDLVVLEVVERESEGATPTVHTLILALPNAGVSDFAAAIANSTITIYPTLP